MKRSMCKTAVSYFFLLISLSLYSQSNKNFTIEYQSVKLDSTYNIQPNNKITKNIEKLDKKLDKKLGTIIGQSTTVFRSYYPVSPLSNLLTDMLLNYGMNCLKKKYLPTANCFSLLNFGGIRADIDKGKITVGEIYNVLPFDNYIVIILIKGDELRKVIKNFNEKNIQPFSNLHITFKQQRAGIILIGNEPLADDKIYNLITVDFIQTGGDNIIPESVDYVRVINTGILLRDAIISEIKNRGVIYAETDERIIIEPQY